MSNKGLILEYIKSSYNLISKKNKPQLKKWAEELKSFLQRRHTNSRQAHEKMLNITNHQRNENQDHNEISPHTCQYGYYQKDNK